MEIEYAERLKEICINCGCTFGAHCATEYYSKTYKTLIPRNCCPGHEGRMDWDQGPGTTFKPSGEFKGEQNGNRKDSKTVEKGSLNG